MSSDSPHLIALDADAARSLYFQSYTPSKSIDGVFVHQLRKHRALEGSFLEIVRLTEGKVDGLPIEFVAHQISYSVSVPNRVNAFHVHPKRRQDELWSVVDGTLCVWLVDVREGSPTLGVKQRVILSGEAPAFLHIPCGVAHGFKSGPSGAALAYVMNDKFSLEDPNEGRLPWDFFGAELWDEDRG